MFFIFKLANTLNAYLRIIKNNTYTFCKALKIHCFFMHQRWFFRINRKDLVSISCLVFCWNTIILLTKRRVFFLFFNSIRCRRHAKKRVITGA